MKHLSVDEIIDFVSCTELDNEGITLIRAVNEHIRRCPKCLKLVRAFQMIYDEFETMCLQENFRDYVYCNVAGLNESDMEQEGYMSI